MFEQLNIAIELLKVEYPELAEEVQKEIEKELHDFNRMEGERDGLIEKLKEKGKIRIPKITTASRWRHTVLYAKDWYEVNPHNRVGDLKQIFVGDNVDFFRLLKKLTEEDPKEPFPEERLIIRLLSVLAGYVWAESTLEHAQYEQNSISNFRTRIFKKTLTDSGNDRWTREEVTHLFYMTEIETLLALIGTWRVPPEIEIGKPDPEVKSLAH